jgi:putative DNA methylase
MAVYTRYAKVLDAEGKALTVREALALINQTLDEALAEQEGDFDSDSRWALAWFGDHGFEEGPFGDAHTYFVRFNTAENALKSAGIIESGRGKVRPRRYLAWESIVAEQLTLNLDPHQVKQAETQKAAADGAVTARLPETYQWLVGAIVAASGGRVAERAAFRAGRVGRAREQEATE